MTLKSQACVPCAKRKVRCDREEPCSNCKRRKNDRCAYPEISPAERIKELEALVESLQESPKNSNTTRLEESVGPLDTPRPTKKSGRQVRQDENTRLDDDSTMFETEGSSIYIESCAWPKWDRNPYGPGDVVRPDTIPFSIPKASDALQNIIIADQNLDLSVTQPRTQHASILWKTFHKKVNPSLKISFDWELKDYEVATTRIEARRQLTPQEYAFIFALYLLSVQSLSDEECLSLLEQPKSALLSGFQSLCEQALAKAGFPTVSDVLTVQALTMYLASGIDRLSIGSTWSLMGLVIRSAERLGLHRDGTALDLSPAETEKRRRTWWQLQHIDLAFTVRAGSTPLTLMADWDTRLPLNIEDDDISADMKEFPEERKGITTMSYCLWTYWVLCEQRTFRRSNGTRFGFGWITNQSIPLETKNAFLHRLESGLNNKFVKHCDPLAPLDTLIHLVVRSFVCGMRRLMLHSLAQQGNKKFENELLDVCTRCLEYDVALQSCQAVENFSWRLEGYFAWSALAVVIYEARRQRGASTGEAFWKLLDKLYDTNKRLSDLGDDHRKICAAELVVSSWRIREDALQESGVQAEKPSCVHTLETKLSAKRSNIANDTDKGAGELPSPGEKSVTGLFDLNLFEDPLFGDIDWSFWEGLM